MTLHARLPLLPRDAMEISPQLACAKQDDLVVFFNASGPIFACDADDKVGLRLAGAVFVDLGLAGPTALAAAMGVHRTTLFRNRRRYETDGATGLEDRQRPRSAHRLTPEVLSTAQELLNEGLPVTRVASQVGVVEGTIRYAIRKGRLVRPAAMAPAAELTPGPAPEPTAELSRPRARSDEDQSSELGVAVKRCEERAMAAVGMLSEAAPRFQAAEAVPGGGVLLALPALLEQGLIEVGEAVYGRLSNGFFGLRSVLLTLTFMALLRIKTPEQLTGQAPGELGLLLGLDRAPEVKTLRRKLAELGRRGQASQLVEALTRRWARAEPRALGYLYVDGHVRPYHGRKHVLPKQHVQRRRQCMPGTKDFWVNDKKSDPLFFVTAEATEGLLKTLDETILPRVRELVGKRRRVTLIFDREGWSPKRFAKWSGERWDFITYRKGAQEPWPEDRFRKVRGVVDGKMIEYCLADVAEVSVGDGVLVREVRRLTDDGHQTSVITSRRDLRAIEIAHRMFSRWRQENFFRYMRHEFGLDHLCTRTVEPADPKRLTSHPKRNKLTKRLGTLRAKLGRLFSKRINMEAKGNKKRSKSRCRGPDAQELEIQIDAVQAEIEKLENDRDALPCRVPVDSLYDSKKIVRLERERKTLMDALKMIAYRAETSLANLLDPFFARSEDEARKYLKALCQLPADLVPDPRGRWLTVRVHGMANPRSTRALRAICELLNEEVTVFPGTKLRLRYEAP